MSNFKNAEMDLKWCRKIEGLIFYSTTFRQHFDTISKPFQHHLYRKFLRLRFYIYHVAKKFIFSSVHLPCKVLHVPLHYHV